METTSDSNDSVALRHALVDRLKNIGLIRTPRVEEAFRAVPRHLFVPEVDIQMAYSDSYIVTRWQDGTPISSSSAPSVMAVMLEMLDLQPGQRVLEIGAGTGYNAALLAHIVGESGQVVTVDLDEDIVHDARAHLEVAGVGRVQVICGDGVQGWQDSAPYDRVILTVGVSDIAPSWREQLRPGGRLVLPFYLTSFKSKMTLHPDQCLLALDRTAHCLKSHDIRPCGFIPLRGAFATVSIDPIDLDPESGLSCLVTRTIDTQAAVTALTATPQDEATGIVVAFRELAGLRLWLALRQACFCELYMKSSSAPAVSPLVRKADDFSATFGLYDRETWCLLMFEEDTTPTADPRRPLKLLIRRFGSDHALAQCLEEQVTAWANAQRPLIWSAQGRMEHLLVRACPLEPVYSPGPHEILLTRPWTQLIFTPLASPR